MATAGQFSSEYTAVPPAAVEQGNSTADISDESRHALYHGPGGWNYQHSQRAAASAQAAEYSAQGQWQYHGGNGLYGSIHPAGYTGPEGYVQYGYAAPAPSQATEWHHQNQTNSVAVPQAVYYSPEGLAYYSHEAQHWDQQGIHPSTDETIPVNNAGPYTNQQYAHPTAETWAQEGALEKRTYNLGVFPTPYANTSYTSEYSEYSHGHPDGWQHRTALIDPITSESHPRESLAPWKWKMVLVANNIISMINGYDVSNAANIQAPVYRAFGNLQLLPWLALSYSVCCVATTPLARKLFKFYDIKILTIGGLILCIAGTALAGAAPNLVCLILGRSLMAFGASIVYQGILSFNIIFAYPNEISLVQASFGASFAFGIVTGPVIGAGFSQTEHATWRWAFYLILPILGIALLLLIFALPKYSVFTEKSVSKHFKEIDWIGQILHSSTFVLLGVATVFSGGVWAWSSVPELAIWIAVVTAAIGYVVQQTFSIGTKPERRIIPVHLLKKRVVFLTWLCTIGGAVTYGVTLYYTPLFYAFTREIGPLEAAVRLLCFTAFFIISIFVAHGLLPYIKFYMPIFLFGGVVLLVGGISLHTVTTKTSTAMVMGFDALVGSGVGILWNLAIPVCSAVLEDREERLDQTTLHSIAQLGGTAFSLSASASIYQNVGLKLVKEAAQFTGFSNNDILALLSGAESDVLDAFSPDVKTLVIEAIVTTIGRCFYLIIGGAVMCFIAAAFLKIEPLEFKRWITKKDVEDNPKRRKSTLYELH
ncbi:major facilitator superfamily domain-containing protein [Xylariaceae sp. FL1651]|nr:major facilitator superfamily domain-containing protein [Xylariaceae sp. FL1651]